MKVVIKSSGEAREEVEVEAGATVAELKTVVEAKLGVEVGRQRLIYSGKVLKDGETLEGYGVVEGSALHLVKGPVKTTGGSTSGAAAGASSANAGGANTSTPSVPTPVAGQPTFNPLAGLTDARYAGYNIPMPSLDQLGVNSDGMAMPSEDQMAQMMDSPMFQESMQAMLSNPQMLDYLIEQSPQLRAMGPAAREMLQSDYVRGMLTNPQAMRSMMEFQRAMGGAGAGAGAGSGFGMGGMGGMGGSFPAPGNPNGATASATADSAATSNANAGTAAGSSRTAGDTTGAAPVNPFASMFTPGANPFAAFGGSGPFGFSAPQAQESSVPPEELYEVQLGQLNDMGFFDFDTNVRALRRAGGRVEGALEMLLSGNI